MMCIACYKGQAQNGCPGLAGLQDPELGPRSKFKAVLGNCKRSGLKEETQHKTRKPHPRQDEGRWSGKFFGLEGRGMRRLT